MAVGFLLKGGRAVAKVFSRGAKGAKAGSKGAKTSSWFNRLRGGDKLPIDKVLGRSKGVFPRAANGSYRIKKGYKLVTKNGNQVTRGGKAVRTVGGTGKAVPWKEGYKVVRTGSALSKAEKSTRLAKVMKASRDTLSNIPIPGMRTSLNLAGFAVVGFGLYKTLSIVGTFSDALEETINNFYGINCDDDDTQCQTQGAKNMLATGVLGVVVIGGVAYYMLKPKKEASSTK